jgi:hypothetical protein
MSVGSGAAADTTPFVFHDASGRRWSRIKRIALAVAAALVVLGCGVLVAVATVAPGRAPLVSAIAPPQVPDWPIRGPGGATVPLPGGAAGSVPGRQQAPVAGAAPSPGASLQPSPTPKNPPHRRPKPTPTP